MNPTYHRPISKNGIEDDDVNGLIKRMALTYDRIVEIVDTLNFCFSIQVIKWLSEDQCQDYINAPHRLWLLQLTCSG